MKHRIIDLHMHSKYSDDGQYEPEELVEMCHEKGVEVMAIADHNQVKAVKAAREKAKEYGIKYISAIEIDCTYHDVNLHVLGYDIPEDESYFQTLNDKIYDQEISLSNKKIELTKKLGFDVTKEELDQLSDNGVYTGEMFAEVILNKDEYKDHPLLKTYRDGGDRSDNPYVNFYWDFYAKGKPCYTEIIYPSYKDTVQNIQKYGGKAVLAHPGENLKGRYEVFDDMMKEARLDGVEAYSSYHDQEAIEYFKKKADEYGIFVTYGSDFHGKTKPSIELGIDVVSEVQQ